MAIVDTYPLDALALAQDLIRCPSVTPADAGALDVLQTALEGLGFTCTRLPFSEEETPDVDNLYAQIGDGAPHFCFAGHTDVVPVGYAEDWTHDPFAAVVEDGMLYGRGATDMKSAIAAFAAATARFVSERGDVPGTISFLITGDEEGPAINGTKKMLEWAAAQGIEFTHCLVGEPTNPKVLGDMMKIGRRGSLNAHITVEGTQGHVAYPHLADNPVPKLLEILRRLEARALDQGNDHFQASNLEVVTVDVGNRASNVIPAKAYGRLNIRYNNEHTGDDLERWIRSVCDEVIATEGGACDLKFEKSGDAFVSQPGQFTALIENAIKAKYQNAPELSTSGGTSDARFIKDYCTVVEFGLIGATMHKVDECVAVKDIEDLRDIYYDILAGYFAA